MKLARWFRKPHSDDLPLFAAGTIAKLICEGYKGFLIRTINDNHAGKGETVGEVILNNERDNMQVAKDPGAGEGIRPGQSKSSNGQYQYCGRSVQTDLPVSLLEG